MYFKMNKTGVLRTVVGITILLVLLVVVIIFIIGPEAVLPKAAAGGEWVADSVFGGLRKEKIDKPPIEGNKAVKEVYDNIASILRTTGNGPCILTHEPFPKNFKNNKITLSQSGQGIYIQLINEMGQFIEGENIAGKVPCVIGEETFKNFYDNYLDGTLCKTNCPIDYTIANIEFRNEKTIYVNGQKREFKDGNLVFKTKDGNICFFPTSDHWFAGCKRDHDIVDDSCIKKIKENIPPCTKIEYKPVFFEGTFYDKKDEWELIENKYYYVEADSRVPYMFRLEAKESSISKKGLVKAEFNKAFSSEPGGIPEKMGVYYDGDYYGLKDDWKFKKGDWIESIATCNKCWVYIGSDDEVPEKFKKEGISLEEKARLFGPPREE